MQAELPNVTIIVPARPGQADITAVEAARRLDYPREKIEVIVARGRQPSVQRNRAVAAAKGEIIYFLDDDSQPGRDALRRAMEHFSNPAVQMVGGPNLCPEGAPFIEQVFAVVLSSWVAFGPSRARYHPVGQPRDTSEKELILCNLLARRQTFVELGGFDESLYPNEENALMDEIQKRGGRLVYDPEVAVFRRPRPTLRAFLRMLLNYGRGRAEQFRLHPTPGSALNFVPPIFVLYLICIPLLARLGWFALRTVPALHLGAGWIPLLAYGLVLAIQSMGNCARFGTARGTAAFPLLVATHLFYGLGFWYGLFTRVKRIRAEAAEVEIERPAA